MLVIEYGHVAFKYADGKHLSSVELHLLYYAQVMSDPLFGEEIDTLQVLVSLPQYITITSGYEIWLPIIIVPVAVNKVLFHNEQEIKYC